MKSLPILVALNAVAWGLALFVFVRQQELGSQLASLQPEVTVRTGSAAGTTGDEDRAAAPAAPSDGDAEADPLLGMSSAEMEIFRKRVRRAQELNADEDRLFRFVERIDRLEEDGRIAPLSSERKQQVAATLMASRRAVPEMLRRLRERKDLNELSSEERRQLIRNEFDRLRLEAQDALEDLVPAADAATIIDDSFQGSQGQSQHP